LLDAEAHSSRRLQSIRADEHTSRIDEVFGLFDVSIRNHNGRMSTIEPFDYRAQHPAFSEEEVILSRMELEQSEKPICHVVWSELLILLHGEVHAQMYACTEPHLAIVLDAIQS